MRQQPFYANFVFSLSLLPLAVTATNTSVAFFNVGACSAVAAVKIDFDNSLGFCPPAFVSGSRCHVPGPYGREVFVDFGGAIDQLDITLLNPAEDDVNLTTPIRVFLAPQQRRNFVGVVLRPGTAALACASGFTVVSDGPVGGAIRPRYFRTLFRHAALDVGSADVVSNGDSTVSTLAEGTSVAIDQLIVADVDMPNPVGISFVTTNGGSAADASASGENARLWGTTCELTATGFVLYGRPPDLPLAVLRLDGAGSDVCSYDDATTNKFTAEVAFYNTIATGQTVAFAFGLSPFLPYSALQTSSPLSWTQTGIGSARQSGELWVKVVNQASGEVVVRSQRVPISAQRRNLVGVSLGACSTCFRLDVVQADNDSNETHFAAPVAAGHFRLIFAHAALTVPAATVVANDDITLLTVQPGGRGQLDHPLIPPHQVGRILKLSFDTGGHSSNTFSTLVDLSTLCDGAAYAVVLMGTRDRLDAFDPLLVQVGGATTACTLSSAAVDAGQSSSLAMLNMAPSAASVRFEWGQTLLSLTRTSVPLTFRASTVNDVPVGDLFVRLIHPDPPNQPLTPVLQLTVHPQARNVIVARAAASATSGGTADATLALTWRLLDLSSLSTGIGAATTRALLVNAVEDSGGVEVGVSVDVSGAVSQALSLPAGGHVPVDFPASGGVSIAFRDSSGSALGNPAQLADGQACEQSVQLVAVGGVLGTSTSATGSSSVATTPGPTHVDVANGYCRLVVPQIPERPDVVEVAEETTTTTRPTLDIFGEDGPGDGGLLGSPAAKRARSPHLLVLAALVACGAVFVRV